MDPRVSSNLFTRRNFLSIAAGFAATAAGLSLTACNNAPSSPSTPATEEKKSANTSYPVSFKLYDGDGNEFEANHDLEMLKKGPYDYNLKHKIFIFILHFRYTAVVKSLCNF